MKRTICELKGLYPTLRYVITGTITSNYLHNTIIDNCSNSKNSQLYEQ